MANLFRSETNLVTGEVKLIQLTDAEQADAEARQQIENVKQSAQFLEQLYVAAEAAELRKLVDVDTGTTPEAIALQTEKTKQGK